MKNRPVNVAELVYPGSRPIGSAEFASQYEQYLSLLTRELDSAGIALHLFAGFDEIRPTDPAAWAIDADRAVQAQFDARPPTIAGEFFTRRLEIQVQAKREAWSRGEIPRRYLLALPRLYGRAFVFALDNVRNLLDRLAREPWAPAGIALIRDRFLTEVPGIRGVRDSFHHPENRAFGEDRRGNVITTAPITHGPIRAGAGNVVVEAAGSDFVATTTETGDYVTIKVNSDVLQAVRRALQSVIDAVPWEGPPEHQPS